METRVAIQGVSSTYSKRWVEYCQAQGVPYEVVDCYAVDIMDKLRDFGALFWNFNQANATDLLMARHVLMAAEHMGLVAFPDTRTAWHFDDKVAEKYLLEAVKAPLVPTYVFYDLDRALEWLAQAEYPLVRKLRRGAGSFNVGLVRSFAEARRYARRAIGRGFPAMPGAFADARTRIRNTRSMKDFWAKLKRRPHALAEHWRRRRAMQVEKGYVLFQKFIPDNQFDTRISVVGDRAWGFTRGVRKDDFRASGSGQICYDLGKVDLKCVRIAFDVSRALGTQSTCYDFVTDRQGVPWIAEISYGFVPEAVYNSPGYWDAEMNWHEGHYWPEHAMIEDVLAEVRRRKAAPR